MNKYHAKFIIIWLLLFTLAVPVKASAYNRETGQRESINKWVVRVEQQVARMIDRYCKQFGRYQKRYGSNMPTFCEQPSESPQPSPTLSPLPSLSPMPTISPLPTLSEEPSPSPTVSPTPTAEVSVVLSEVYYDVDDSHGKEPANEWVEVRNNGSVAVDLSGFIIADAASSDYLPAGTVVPAGGYLVITNDSSTSSYWNIPVDAVFVALGSPIGNALSNSGDVVYLKNADGVILDAVSWGSSVAAFDPAVTGVAEGSSIVRTDPTVDTGMAADWQESLIPTPGQ